MMAEQKDRFIQQHANYNEYKTWWEKPHWQGIRKNWFSASFSHNYTEKRESSCKKLRQRKLGGTERCITISVSKNKWVLASTYSNMVQALVKTWTQKNISLSSNPKTITDNATFTFNRETRWKTKENITRIFKQTSTAGRRQLITDIICKFSLRKHILRGTDTCQLGVVEI